MKVLIACECSGAVRDAFIEKGHDAWSCDILPCEGDPEKHLHCDVFTVLDKGWDLMIAHPPCTDLSVAGARWFKEKRKDGSQKASIEFFMRLANANVNKICVENPVSIMSKEWRKPDQIIQPWMFGDEFSKKTCLWLKNLPKLEPTKIVGKGEIITYESGRTMPKWYADAFRLPKAERSKLRSRTFPGIAQAMANQWG
jgi:site-specific DNA-cytosine methylase